MAMTRVAWGYSARWAGSWLRKSPCCPKGSLTRRSVRNIHKRNLWNPPKWLRINIYLKDRNPFRLAYLEKSDRITFDRGIIILLSDSIGSNFQRGQKWSGTIWTLIEKHKKTLKELSKEEETRRNLLKWTSLLSYLTVWTTDRLGT